MEVSGSQVSEVPERPGSRKAGIRQTKIKGSRYRAAAASLRFAVKLKIHEVWGAPEGSRSNPLEAKIIPLGCLTGPQSVGAYVIFTTEHHTPNHRFLSRAIAAAKQHVLLINVTLTTHFFLPSADNDPGSEAPRKVGRLWTNAFTR